MPLAPFAPRPTPDADQSRRARLAVLLAVLGIGAALLAYAISPSVRHAVKRAAHSVSHAVTRVFKGEGRRAPALPAAVLVGPPATLASLHGHNTLVTFWAADCAQCARQAHAVEAFATSATGRGRVVGVNFRDSTARARQFIHHHRWTFTNLHDASGATGRRYGVKDAASLPITYVVDSSGRIIATLRGALTQARMAAGLRTES